MEKNDDFLLFAAQKNLKNQTNFIKINEPTKETSLNSLTNSLLLKSNKKGVFSINTENQQNIKQNINQITKINKRAKIKKEMR